MTTTTTTSLPADFADLEPFAGWALQLEGDRWSKRLGSTMPELQAFYDAALPRMEAAMEHIDQHDLQALPADAQNLLWLFCSLVSVSFAIEAWRQPFVPDSGASSIDCVVEFPY